MNNLTLRELWQTKLQELYSTEQQIISALPEMIGASTSSALRAALDKHLQRTKIQVERLDLIFKQCGISAPTSRQSSGIEGIIRAGSEMIRDMRADDVRDAAIIAAAQQVEHYEMAGYGCVRTWAHQLDEDQAAHLLNQTLDEEGAADHELTDIAQSGINQDAVAGSEVERPARVSRLRYIDVDDMPGATAYRDTKVRNRAGDDLGRVDGFIADASGRPYYVVVDSGGLFIGRRYVVPVGRADFARADRVFTVDLDKDTLKRYPEFHRDAFLAMTDEEARRYEWRVLEAIDPKAARAATMEWDYNAYPYYRQPDWFERGGAWDDRSVRAGTTTTRREVPIVEREDRERVVARQDEYEPRDESRERDKPPRSRDRS